MDLQKLATAKLAKMDKKPEAAIEIEIGKSAPPKPFPPAKGAPPEGGDLADEIAKCSEEFGMSPDELLAEFKEFLASKHSEGAEPPGEEGGAESGNPFEGTV